MKWQTWKVSIRQKYQSKRPWKVCIFATHRTDRPQTSALFIHFSNTLLDTGLSFYFEYFDLSSKVNLLPYGVDLLKKFRRVVLLCVTEAAPWTPAGHCCLWISEHYHFLLQTPKSNLLSSSSKVTQLVTQEKLPNIGIHSHRRKPVQFFLLSTASATILATFEKPCKLSG